MVTSKIVKQTRSLSSKEAQKEWVLIDASEIVLGRLASVVSNILRGKHKPTFTPHVDCGDNVVIINAEKVKCYRPSDERTDGELQYLQNWR